MREAATFAVVCFGEIDELEVKAEGARELVGSGGGELRDAMEGALEVLIGRGFCVERGFPAGGGFGRGSGSGRGGTPTAFAGAALEGFAAGDGGAAELLHLFENACGGLFAENFAEEHAKGADVTAEGGFLEVAGRSLQFSQPLRPVRRRPEGGHASIMHCAVRWIGAGVLCGTAGSRLEFRRMAQGLGADCGEQGSGGELRGSRPLDG